MLCHLIFRSQYASGLYFLKFPQYSKGQQLFKITADGDCSHEIERCSLLGRKAMTNVDSILKSRDIVLPAKVHLVKALVFPVVTYECESWTIKKTECWKADALELWCWWRFLNVTWTARKSNQSILKEISSEYSLEGLMLKLQYFASLIWRADLLEKKVVVHIHNGILLSY